VPGPPYRGLLNNGPIAQRLRLGAHGASAPCALNAASPERGRFDPDYCARLPEETQYPDCENCFPRTKRLTVFPFPPPRRGSAPCDPAVIYGLVEVGMPVFRCRESGYSDHLCRRRWGGIARGAPLRVILDKLVSPHRAIVESGDAR
jgi:hypothetical protein